jgi:NADPH:quinone reductase
VRIEAAGVNFIDVYQRTGAYKIALPYGLGLEGAGIVESVGDGVLDVCPGDRVAWASVPGSYATHVIAPADKVVKVPDGVSSQDAAAAMLQGMTAHYLTTSTFPLQPGHTCLVHAAAGGLGRLICQMARQRGARVIGTVSTQAKAEVARAAGADETILYTEQDFEAEVKRLTDGRGVDVVYDTVGKDTFDKSLNCLRPRGYLVLAGQSSGPVPPLDPQVLNAKGSLFLTRPTLFHHVATREDLVQRGSDVLQSVAAGTLRLHIAEAYPLTEAGRAHEELTSRRTIGKLLLVP